MANHTKEELGKLVAVTLDVTGINPQKVFIDKVIPDCVLHDFKPLDVLAAAEENGFIIDQCYLCHESYKANGVWIKPELPFALELSRHQSLSHGQCDNCYSYALALNKQTMEEEKARTAQMEAL